MPIRAWGYVAALGLTLATSALAQQPQQPDDQRQGEQAAQSQEDEASPVESWRPALLDWLSAKLGVTGCGPETVNRLGYSPEIEGEDYYSACDLEAQESVANSTRWLLAVAVAQTALGVFGTLLVWRTLRVSYNAIAITREVGEAQARAYLTIEKFGAYFLSPSQIGVDISIRNSGQSPARDVHMVLGIFFFNENSERDGWWSLKYSNPKVLGDAPAQGHLEPKTENSRTFDLPEDIRPKQNEDGTPNIILAYIGVFAADVFGWEIFEYRNATIAPSHSAYLSQPAYALPPAVSMQVEGDIENLRANGWRPPMMRDPKPKRRKDN